MEVAPSPNAVKQAIQWMLKLRESGNNITLLQQCEHWRKADREHELAWQRVVALHQDLDLRAIPGAGLALQTLETSQQRLRRRQALKLLGGVALVGSAAWLAKDMDSINTWTSDLATTTGERRTFSLPDGSILQLNTRSAVDLAFTDQQRLIYLKQGELMLSCKSGHPIRVRTRDALIEGVEGNVVVRQEADCTRVSVAQGNIALYPSADRQLLIGSYQEWRVDNMGAHRLDHVDMDASAWTEGLIVTRDMRLADFLVQVSRYRHGYLSCSDDIANLRLSGVYRLEDPEHLIQLLPQTLPVRLNRHTRWWIRLESVA
ncbi:FecR domain-containing protein [Pseudomonas sp. PSKL.D1]|uniref:FecR family protein n=1 Tax=Pseudomonas sp. PSKL.D1 TaxID=3029060 RepID=UPI0023818A85|nr:FecR domain-containing protein [Pseudomonas sp. PSKL.D1]WDY60530.1 FecR domain-containing protein [Pseudomonas sp. PSKL.D1]